MSSVQRAVPRAERMAASLLSKITLERCPGKKGGLPAAFLVEDNGFVHVIGREFHVELLESVFREECRTAEWYRDALASASHA